MSSIKFDLRILLTRDADLSLIIPDKISSLIRLEIESFLIVFHPGSF
jgi:hypothetical protein